MTPADQLASAAAHSTLEATLYSREEVAALLEAKEREIAKLRTSDANASREWERLNRESQVTAEMVDILARQFIGASGWTSDADFHAQVHDAKINAYAEAYGNVQARGLSVEGLRKPEGE